MSFLGEISAGFTDVLHLDTVAIGELSGDYALASDDLHEFLFN